MTETRDVAELAKQVEEIRVMFKTPDCANDEIAEAIGHIDDRYDLKLTTAEVDELHKLLKRKIGKYLLYDEYLTVRFKFDGDKVTATVEEQG